MPEISILMPVHNAGRFLRLAVCSTLEQTFRNFELIVIDDGSTDGAVDGIDADPRIRVLRQEQKGAPTALNAGLAVARGDIIAFLDQDDLWMPEKLAAHRDWLKQRPDLDLTFDWSRFVDENGVSLELSSNSWMGPVSFEQMLRDFVVGNTSAMLARRSAIQAIGGFDIALHRAYDLDLCLRILANGKCEPLCRHLTLYRRHTGQMSQDWRSLQREWERVLQKLPGYAPPGYTPSVPIADSNMRRYFAWLAFEGGSRWDAIRLLASAIQRAPSQALGESRNWLLLGGIGASAVLPAQLWRRAAKWGQSLVSRRNVSTSATSMDR